MLEFIRNLLIILGVLMVMELVFQLSKFVNTKMDREKTQLEVLKETIKLDNKKFNVSTVIDNNYISLLEIFITLQLNDLLKLKPKYLEADYINLQLEKELESELVQRVKLYMSDSIIQKLTMIYKAENLSTIIAEKCKIAIVNFKLEKSIKNIEKNIKK